MFPICMTESFTAVGNAPLGGTCVSISKLRMRNGANSSLLSGVEHNIMCSSLQGMVSNLLTWKITRRTHIVLTLPIDKWKFSWLPGRLRIYRRPASTTTLRWSIEKKRGVKLILARYIVPMRGTYSSVYHKPQMIRNLSFAWALARTKQVSILAFRRVEDAYWKLDKRYCMTESKWWHILNSIHFVVIR